MKGRTLVINRNQELSLKKILKKSFLLRQLSFLKTKFFNNDYLNKTNIKFDSERDLEPIFEVKDKKRISNKVFQTYKSQLKTFVEIAKAHNVEPILMTQANRLSLNPDPKIIRPETEKGLKLYGISYKTFINTYVRLNNIIREVAEEESIALIDLDKEIPKTRKYIYDIFHYNDLGSDKAARIISNYLKKII